MTTVNEGERGVGDESGASPRRDFVAGGRAVGPILLGIVPFGLIAGVTAVSAGISPLQALGMSVIIFAGASQLAAIDLIGRSAPLAVVVLTVIVINLRMVMYSASIAPYFRQLAAPWKWLTSYLLTDQAYAVSLTEFRETAPDERSRKWYYLGAAAMLWITWQICTFAGAVVGTGMPDGLSLEFAVPLTFMALLVPALDDRATEVAALVAGVVGIVGAVLPFNLGLITAALIGIASGVALEIRAGTFPKSTSSDAEGGEST